jgi:hypothetical protein
VNKPRLRTAVAALLAGCTWRRPVLLAGALVALLLVPALQHWLTGSMWRHMALQFALWMVAGALLVAGLSPAARARVARWNAYGISGLVGAGTVLAVLMVPRVLDLALVSAPIEAAKCVALLLAGAALRLSWRSAGLVVQGFFLGNMLPMTAVVGQLYIDSPLRLCNAYLLDDQARLGHWLVAAASLLALGWLAQVAWRLVRRDALVTQETQETEQVVSSTSTVTPTSTPTPTPI